MNTQVCLTKRESQIAELIAWGASKKEVAYKLFVSPRTVENITRSIYEKTGVTKANELSAWWFCIHFNISFNLSPLKKALIAVSLLALFLVYEAKSDQTTIRVPRTRVSLARSARSRRNEESDHNPFQS